MIPAKNEAANLPQLIDEIVQTLRPVRHSGELELTDFEIVVVDDGSTDATPQVLRELSDTYPELYWLKLTATVGQSSAMMAGIRASRGDWIATLDADLQNDPADLIQLWKSLPGHDAALGYRAIRQDVVSKRVISRCANRIRNTMLGQSIRDTGCSARIFSRAMALRLPTFHGMHRFMGALLLREGCELIQIPVNHRRRQYGRSHYNIWNRSLSVIVDLLGVAWLLRRPVHYQVTQMQHSQERMAESGFKNTDSARGTG